MLMSIKLPFHIRETQFPILGSVTILSLQFRALDGVRCTVYGVRCTVYGVRFENYGILSVPAVYLVIYLKQIHTKQKTFCRKKPWRARTTIGLLGYPESV